MSNTPHQTAERAVWHFLADNAPDWLDDLHIHRGIENRDISEMEGEESSLREPPCVTVICETGRAIIPFRGNWDIDMELTIETVARDTTQDQNDETAASILDLFFTDTIADDLSRAIDGINIAQVLPGDSGYKIEGGIWVSYAKFTLQAVALATLR